MIKDVESILQQVRINILKTTSMLEDSGVYIDVGCQTPDSTPSLPKEKIINSKFSLLFEPDNSSFYHTNKFYESNPNVFVNNDIITPDNIDEKIIKPLKKVSLEKSIFLADIDIDGYDFFVAQSLISKIKPLFLSVEINEKIPPPVKFTLLYDKNYDGPKEHFYGASISKMYELIEYGYDMVQLFFNTLIFIDRERNPYYSDKDKFSLYKPKTAEELYKKQYLDIGLQEIWYNANVKHWLNNENVQETVEHINKHYSNYSGKYEISL
jgi:hypothetical protein